MTTSLRRGRNRLAMRLWWRTWTGRILTAVRAVSAPANSCSTGELTYELGTDVFAEPTHPSPSPGFSSRFLHLVLIRTVCRHSVAKVSPCPRAAACWGNRTGGNDNGQNPGWI